MHPGDSRPVAGRSSASKRPRRRATYACARCHRKKIRCDNRKPACSNCVKNNAPCLGILNGETKTVVPRSVVQYLQDAIAQKELELQQRQVLLESQDTPDARPREQASSNGFTRWLTRSLESELSSRFLDTQDGFPIDSFLFSSSHLPPTGATLERRVDDSNHDVEQRNEPSQVPYKIAELLVKNYSANILPLYPFFDADDLWARFQRVYPTDSEQIVEALPYDVFIVLTVLCVSMMTSRFSDSSRVRSSSESIFRQALSCAPQLSQSSIESLQVITLLAQYSYLMPQAASIWETVGLSMRMAVELGLHRDPDETIHQTGITVQEANLRRCIFWCIYEMDRSICGTSHRRLSLAEGAITTKYPLGMEGTCYLSVVKFRRIQAEITTVNYLCGDAPLIAVGQSYEVWAQQMEDKILDWRETITSNRSRGPEWFDLAVNHGIVFLNRPSPRNPSPCTESLVKCFVAAADVVLGWWEHAHSGFLKYSWHAVHQGFESATVMLYVLRKCSSLLRARYGIRKILETVHSFSSLFLLLSEGWQNAASCYETYERLKTIVLKEVMRSSADDPRDDIGDELDQLVLPPEAIEKIGRVSTGAPVTEESDSPRGTPGSADNPQTSRRTNEAVHLQSRLQERSESPMPLRPNLNSIFPNEDDSALAGIDWGSFASDAFDEQLYMLWSM
ncbi:fungal-specific transcription factor domain-containing protein [Hypoxylon crocopeplum]|nr:fungal-specific transcription factor domain-containing protein [Hypoxylon crocopeplum]